MTSHILSSTANGDESIDIRLAPSCRPGGLVERTNRAGPQQLGLRQIAPSQSPGGKSLSRPPGGAADSSSPLLGGAVTGVAVVGVVVGGGLVLTGEVTGEIVEDGLVVGGDVVGEDVVGVVLVVESLS